MSTTTEIVLPSRNHRALLSTAPANKDAVSRLTLFVKWLDQNDGYWGAPDLAAYRDYLLREYAGARGSGKPLTPPSALAHLSTIRGHYQRMLLSNSVRDVLYTLTDANAGKANQKADVDEWLIRLQNAINPKLSPVSVVKVQDEGDGDHIRLTTAQAHALLEAPLLSRDKTPLSAIRDTALIALLLCTGIREAELIALDVDDLRQQYGGALALRIQHGKGNKRRHVPYGALDWCLVYVDKWLEAAGITEGAVFRALRKPRLDGVQEIRPGRLALRAVQDILNNYPVLIGRRVVPVNPHDLRRTYARLLYEANFDLKAISENMGHSDTKVTERYIGTLSGEHRKPPAILRQPRIDTAQLGGAS